MVAAATMPGAADAEADEERRKQRKDAGVTAVLHEAYPVRYWDHDLGPAAPHLFWAGQLPADEPPADAEPAELRDLTPDAGPRTGAGDDFTLSPDGRLLARSEEVRRRPGRPPHPPRADRDRRPATTRALVDDPLADVYAPASPPTARRVVCVRERLSTYAEPPDYTLLLVDVADGHGPRPHRRTSTGGRARRSSPPTARRSTSSPTTTGGTRSSGCPWPAATPVRLTADGAYSDLQVARDGSALYALRSAYDSPPLPVRLDPADPAAGAGAAAQPRHDRPAARAPCTRSRRPPPTAPACSRGWCCPRARPRSRPRRCCCGSTAAR